MAGAEDGDAEDEGVGSVARAMTSALFTECVSFFGTFRRRGEGEGDDRGTVSLFYILHHIYIAEFFPLFRRSIGVNSGFHGSPCG